MGKKEGGRTLNPADKLRKEQRIKEQKKNAERRAATRAAIVGQKTEDELRSLLAGLKKAEFEGRADGKQLQMKKQIEERLSALEKEESSKPAAPKSLEEMYPDAEGSIYYHPIENPYGVPPPGCFQMFKPGYIPKAQRHLLPLDHPSHPDYKPHLAGHIPGSAHALPPTTSSGAHAASMPPATLSSHSQLGSASDSMDVELDEDLDELEGIPPPPEEIDSDGDNPPPPPPTTEDDLQNIVYEDEAPADEGDDPSAYFVVDEDEMDAPPPKRGPPVFPPPFYPPPFMHPPPPTRPPHHTPNGHQGNYRGRGRGNDRPRGPPRPTPASDGGIPDPLDLGPLKKEGRESSRPQNNTSASTPSPATPTPTAAPTPAPINYGPMLVPAAVRMKRKMPTESRPVAPKAAPPSQAPSNNTQPQSAPNSSYDKFMSDMKQMGAI